MIEIIDSLKPSQDVKNKIQPISCLQASRNKEGDYYFYSSKYNLKDFSRIERIAQIKLDKTYDLMLCGDNLFLGHWNDGVA